MAGEVFISYRRSDLAHAKRLHELLKAEGVDAWYDAHVGAGQDWRQATAAALSHASVFVLLFSKAASESEDIAKELAAATYSKKLVIPVRIEAIRPGGAFLYELAAKNWIDAYDDTDAVLADLAKNLAVVVKEGVTIESAVQFRRGRRPGARRFHLPVWGIAGAVAAALAAAGISAMLGGASQQPVKGRIALFSIDVVGEDKQVEAAAASTTDNILTILTALQRDVVASNDTAGVPPRERLDRALQLRAQYVVSGSATRLGDLVSVSIRVEDTLSRSMLWTPDPFEGSATNPASPAAQAAGLLNDRLTCIINARASIGAGDMRIVSRLPKACQSVRRAELGSQERWSELALLAPNSAWVRANEAASLLGAIGNATPAAAEHMIRRAEESLRKAEELDPDLAEVQSARVAMARVNGASRLEVEKLFQAGLAVAENGPHLNGQYSAWLYYNGRIRDALPYGRKAVMLDPLSPPKLLGVAGTFVHGGEVIEPEGWLQQRHDLFPDSEEWQGRVIYALFHGVGDVGDVLADPPLAAGSQTRACLKLIVEQARRATPEGRRLAADKARSCTDAGLDPVRANEIRIFLDDFDWVFESPDNVQANPGFLFDPRLTRLHAHPKFAKLMQDAGLLDYWRDSGNAPDFCADGKAPVCTLITAK